MNNKKSVYKGTVGAPPRDRTFNQALEYVDYVNGKLKAGEDILVPCKTFFKSLNWNIVHDFRDWLKPAHGYEKIPEIEEIAAFISSQSDAFKNADYHEICASFLCYKKNAAGQIIVCMGILPFKMITPTVYLTMLCVAKEYRGKGYGSQAIFSISEFLRSFLGKKNTFYDLQKATGMYIVAGMSTVSKPDRFFASLGFEKNIPSIYSPWKNPNYITCYRFVQTNNNLEANITLRNLETRSFNQIIIDFAVNEGDSVVSSYLGPDGKEKLQNIRSKIEEEADKKPKMQIIEEKKSYEQSVQLVETKATTQKKTTSVKSSGSSKWTSRHCFLEKCKGKLFDNSNWAAHYKRTHKLTKETLDHSKYVNCVGNDCPQCSKNETKSTASHKEASGKSFYICSKCGDEKRQDYISSKNPVVICKVCAKKALKDTVTKKKVSKKKIAPKRTYNESSLSNISDEDDKIVKLKADDNIIKSQRLSQTMLEHLPESGMGIEEKQDVEMAYLEQDDLGEYRDNLYLKNSSSPNKRPKTNNAIDVESITASILHRLSTTIASSSAAFNTTAPVQSDIQIDDRQSLTGMTSVSQSNKDETMLVNALKQIQSSKDQSEIMGMIFDVCGLFSKDFSATHIKENQSIAFIAGLIKTLNIIGTLPIDSVTGLITASFVLGESCWVSCVKELSSINVKHMSDAVDKFSSYLNRQYGNHTASWMKENWQHTNQYQVALIHYCKENSVQTTDGMLTMSLIVQQLQPLKYAPFGERTVKQMDEQVVQIIKCIKRKPFQQKISQDQLLDAILCVASNSNVSVVDSLQETLINTPVAQWKELIESTVAVSNIADAKSIQTFLNELQDRCGEIKQLKDDITTSEDERFALILEMCVIKPNNKQFALSQYSVGNTYNQPRQLWIVPSGQGKSRIMVGIEMIYLMSGAGSKIHVVFSSEHLLQRDKTDAVDILFYIEDYDTKVDYRVGIDFEPEAGALILIDEADVYMFSDPEKFRKFTSANVCIGFTATAAMTPMELKVQEQLNFKQYSYSIDQGAVDTFEKMAVDLLIDAFDDKTKVACIAEIAKTNPVLVYGSDELLAALKEAEINVLQVNDQIDYNLLRKLDTIGEDKRYSVTFATDLKWMRGIDYRSKSLPITLIIAKSFPSKRDALQGFNRVGRFTDKGIRARFTDTTILDLAQEKQMSGEYLKFILILNKNKVQLKPIPLGKITTTYKPKGSNKTKTTGMTFDAN